MSTPVWGQAGPANPQQVEANKLPGDPDEPVKKPNLAERNNITPKPLMTLQQEKENAKLRKFDYSSALRSQNPSKADEDIIRAGVRDRVYRMTIPENWANIANLRRDLVEDIDNDRFAGDSRPRTRLIALTAAVKLLNELLGDQPEFVKLNAVLLLGDLNEKSANLRDNLPATPYAPAAEPLLQAVQASDQPTVVKVVAVRGLARILRDGNPPRAVRDQVASVLVGELRDSFGKSLPEGETWYQWRLVDALGMIGEPRTAIQQPLAVDALWEAMLNENLQPHVRTHAARALSQIDLDGQFNVGLLAHEIVRLCGTLTAQFNEKPQLDYWRECFTDLYFAFKPQFPDEVKRGWGLNQQIGDASLRSHAALVDGAYAEVLKMVNGVMENDPPRPVAGATLQEAVEWLRSNSPTDQKLHPQAKTVEAIQKAHARPADKNTAVSQKTDPGSGA
ncbi:MAG: HEAT repeat domain-containing protein [Planctomycetaceae bacterium]